MPGRWSWIPNWYPGRSLDLIRRQVRWNATAMKYKFWNFWSKVPDPDSKPNLLLASKLTEMAYFEHLTAIQYLVTHSKNIRFPASGMELIIGLADLHSTYLGRSAHLARDFSRTRPKICASQPARGRPISSVWPGSGVLKNFKASDSRHASSRMA